MTKLFFNNSSVYSPWYKSSFVIDSIEFIALEYFVLYNKAILFNDIDSANLILNSSSNKECKYYGRLISNYDEEVWLKNLPLILYKGLCNKFEQNKELKSKFLSEKVDMFIYQSYDSIYGNGNPKSDKMGVNILGNALSILYYEYKSKKGK